MRSSLIEELVQNLGSDKVLIGEEIKERYTHIWKMAEPLKALACILPKTTEDVSTALKICHSYDQPINIRKSRGRKNFMLVEL